jgi:hypothetical protein
MRKVSLVVMVVALASTFAMFGGNSVATAGQNDVIERGSCSGSSDWKLKLSPDNGRLQVEFEVDQNVSGDTWRVRIRHGDTVAFRGNETTGGASGSFTVNIREDDLAGTDAFRAKARNLSTDELCVGRASI